MTVPASAPNVLVLELWGLGDVALALPFIQSASAQATVTVVAKPAFLPLIARFAPAANVRPATLPWTAFRGKYRLHRWPWPMLRALRRELRAGDFSIGVSARPDPRDHLLLALAGARRRIGFPRRDLTGPVSRALLTHCLAPSGQHRLDYWRSIAAALGWPWPRPGGSNRSPAPHGPPSPIVLHSGAAQPTKVWPLANYTALAARLQQSGRPVRVLCDADQANAWRESGFPANTPRDVPDLLAGFEGASAFIGNDSGPGHVAALCGVPTFTIFGNQFPAAFAPVHRDAAWVEGGPCPYKPCYDHCRYAVPHCLHSTALETVWARVGAWLDKLEATQ